MWAEPRHWPSLRPQSLVSRADSPQIPPCQSLTTLPERSSKRLIPAAYCSPRNRSFRVLAGSLILDRRATAENEEFAFGGVRHETVALLIGQHSAFGGDVG